MELQGVFVGAVVGFYGFQGLTLKESFIIRIGLIWVMKEVFLYKNMPEFMKCLSLIKQ